MEEERLKEVFSEILGVNREAINLDLSLKKDLGVDSTEMIDLMTAIEKKFNVRVTEKVQDRFTSVRDVYNFVVESNVVVQ